MRRLMLDVGEEKRAEYRRKRRGAEAVKFGGCPNGSRRIVALMRIKGVGQAKGNSPSIEELMRSTHSGCSKGGSSSVEALMRIRRSANRMEVTRASWRCEAD